MKFLIICFIAIISAVSSNGQQLVLRGDHADPSVVKIGDTYWASATTSNWFPAYPILQSKDLVNWKMNGYVFNQLPAWADYYFWAPEISYENGKVYIYYAAHKKGGNLCLSVASADNPEGPYTDHGPLMCQEVGSIDAFPMRDEQGKLYMIWKEDGNSVEKPTPIWVQQMNEERTALIGEKRELFRNDKGWEGNLVEGVSMIKNGGYYYAFYAAAACCGRECTYQTGVARSKFLLGPWEKYDKNPILGNDNEWKCPGHGTPVEKDGKYYFLYHAYDKNTNVYTGREGLLIEFRFTADGWIEFIKDTAVSDVAMVSITDNFSGRTISNNWQWSVFQPVIYNQKRGNLELMAMPSPSGAYLGVKTLSGNYTSTVEVKTKRTNAASGIGAIGDDKNTVSVLYNDNVIKLVQLKEGIESEVLQKKINVRGKIYLQMQVKNGKDLTFFYSLDGKNFQQLNATPVDGRFLPPWDRSLRVGLIAKGETDQKVSFNKFQLHNK
jgi:beta-xylosidase